MPPPVTVILVTLSGLTSLSTVDSGIASAVAEQAVVPVATQAEGAMTLFHFFWSGLKPGVDQPFSYLNQISYGSTEIAEGINSRPALLILGPVHRPASHPRSISGSR